MKPTTQSPKQANKFDSFVGKYLWIVNLIIVLGLLLTKGWIGVFMIFFWPATVLIFIVQIIWFRSAYKLVQRGAAPHYLMTVLFLMSLAFIFAYICLPGFGDTYTTGAFGVIETQSGSALYNASVLSMYISLGIGITLFIYAFALDILARIGKLTRSV